MDIRHIKITSSEGLYRINEKKAFKSLVVSFTPSSERNAQMDMANMCHPLFFTTLHISHDCPLFLSRVSGDDRVLPEELPERILPGRGHNTAHTLQTTGAKLLIEQHTQLHTRYRNFATFSNLPYKTCLNRGMMYFRRRLRLN